MQGSASANGGVAAGDHLGKGWSAALEADVKNLKGRRFYLVESDGLLCWGSGVAPGGRDPRHYDTVRHHGAASDSASAHCPDLVPGLEYAPGIGFFHDASLATETGAVCHHVRDGGLVRRAVHV